MINEDWETFFKPTPNKFINLWVVYICYWDNGFWMRLFNSWWGIHCIHKSEKMVFSERNGYTKTVTIGNYRFKILKPS